MTIVFIILDILFLIFLPIINTYFPLRGFTSVTSSTSEDYDLNPNKRKVDESKEEYSKRRQYLNRNQKPLFTLKGFCIKFILVLLLLIFLFIILFS